MGHYYSEMVSDAEQEREAAEKKARREKQLAKLKEMIEEDGLESVLLDIIKDRTMVSIRVG